MTPDIFSTGIKMIGMLAFTLAVLLGLLMAIRRVSTGGLRLTDRRMRILETSPLGFKKSLVMVQVPGSVLILGLSGDRIVPLGKIDDPGLLAELSAAEDAAGTSFASHLSRLSVVLKRNTQAEGEVR